MSSFPYIVGRSISMGAQGAINGALPLPLNGLDGGTPDFQEMLSLQRQVNAETLEVSLQSNLIKAHHDARMSAVRNLRS